MNGSLIITFAAILIVGALLFAVITLTRQTGHRYDQAKYRSKWLTIEQSLKKDSEASYHLAILNADKLLDHALRERGTKGQTMGERMKATQWSNANVVWAAHKLRNQIAHESDVSIAYDTARRALASFKQGLKDVGAI